MLPRRLLLLAGRMCYRDVRAAPAKFLATLLLMAVAAAGLFAARGITAGFKLHLVDQAREWIAADAAVVYFGSAPTPEQWSAVRELEPGIQVTLVTEGGALATSLSAPDPAAVALKAVDPGVYPFYGRVGLRSGRAISEVLDSHSVLVSSDLLSLLGLRVGDTIGIRGTEFRVRDVITSEPDRFLAAQMQSARVIISQDGLARTSLFKLGPAYYRLLIRGSSGPQLGTFEGLFPEAEVVDHSTPTPQLTAALEGILPLLDVLAFLTLLASCIAIAAATYFHLLARLDSIAMLKGLGATSSQIMSIYWLQALLTAAAGIGLGIAGGRALETSIVILSGRLLDIHLRTVSGASVALETAGLCLLAAFAAPWLPLARIRHVSAQRLQRRDFSAGESAPLSGPSVWAGIGAAGTVVLIFATVIPQWGPRIVLLAIVAIGFGARGLIARIPLSRLFSRTGSFPSWMAWPVRHGVANLFRYRRQFSVVTLAIATGTALMVAAASGEQQIAKRLFDAFPLHLPDLLLVDVSESERAELSGFLAHERGVRGRPSFLPTSYLTLVGADGRTLDELRNGQRAWIQRTWQATCLDHDSDRVRIVKGRWWKRPTEEQSAALDQAIAQTLGVGVGSHLEFLSRGQPLKLRVAALLDIPPSGQVWGHGIFLDCADIKPAAYNGGITVEPARLPEVRRALHDRFPDVATMLVGELMQRLQKVGIEVARALRVIALCVICVALALLAAVIYSVRAFRLSEIAILRAFGARNTTLIALLAAEYLSVGAAAGVLGAAGGCAAVTIVFHQVTGVWKIGFGVREAIAIITGASLLAGFVGVAVSLPLLRPRPLHILRRQ